VDGKISFGFSWLRGGELEATPKAKESSLAAKPEILTWGLRDRWTYSPHSRQTQPWNFGPIRLLLLRHLGENVSQYSRYTTTVVGAHSVPDWYESLDRRRGQFWIRNWPGSM
jgi:hypothetical protein